MKNRKELSGNEEGREGRVGNRISELKEEGRREGRTKLTCKMDAAELR